jgi:hypothetical protein
LSIGKELRNWIDASYASVFAPEWLYGGKKRGWSLRYKKTRAFCALLPAYRLLSVLVVLGRAEREKFEARRYFWGPQLVKLYDEARAYPDGKWLTIPISSADDRQEVAELMRMSALLFHAVEAATCDQPYMRRPANVR